MVLEVLEVESWQAILEETKRATTKKCFSQLYAWITLAPLHDHASRRAAELLVKHSRNLAAALEDAASAEEPFVRVCREVLKGKRGCGVRKRKPSAKIFESINKMLGQIVLQKQS